MRLHRLRVTAFQAFADSEQVDFDALAESGLFLLHGDTGAGKTTLLDAVCFALYDAVPGARNRDARLRSDHADPATRTEVELEVTLRERRLRIVRRPRQERPKLRGEGMTEELHSCTVEELRADGDWSVLATRPEEARAELGDLLGMSCDQFCQVVLLPQGEFARFLRADSTERQTVLERLFGTDRFTRVEHWLKERRIAAAAELRERSQDVRDLVSRAAQASGAEPPEELHGVAEWIGDLGVAAQTDAATAAGAAATARNARVEAERALTEGSALAMRRTRHTAAVDELAGWEGRRTARDAAEQELVAARRAAPVAALLAGDVAGSEAELSALASQAEEAARRAASATRALTIAAEQRTVLETRIAAARGAAERAERLDADARSADARAQTATERDRLHTERGAADERRRAAVDAEQTARDTWLDVRRRRLDGMAAELAGGLRPGEPCAVCGALEHPAPAGHDAADEMPSLLDTPTGEHVTTAPLAEQERKAEREHQRRVTARTTAERELADLDARLAAAQAVAGDAPTEQLAADAAQLAAALAAARAEAGTLAEAEQALAALATETSRHEQTRRDAEQLATTAQITHAERTAAVTAARERAAQAAADAGFPDLAAARAAIRDDAAQRALEQRLRDYDTGLAERRTRTQDPELVAAAAAPAPDVPALEAHAGAATVQDREATRRDTLAQQRLTALTQLAADLDEALAALAPVAERERLVRELAGLVDGSSASNRLRMRLSAYVLAARLEEVAAAATVRLERMSNGRYRLVHSDAGARGRQRGGLELRIVDGWTGRERAPSTLSGGETFLASLALALGLADVVAAEAGGSRLETLFVDEGFGSLDEHTLDEVLDVLDALREGGRVVGIVSHVAELRQRIPTRVHVVKGRDGSHVEQRSTPVAA